MRKILAPILALLLMSCQDDDVKQDVDSTTPPTSTTSALGALTEYAVVNKVFQDLGNNGIDALLSAENSMTGKPGESKTDQPIITIVPNDETTFPKTITVDYQSGVTYQNGITLKGKITIVSTDWYRNPNSEHTATFTDFYHEDTMVEGLLKVKNLGKDQEGNVQYNVVIENGKITTSEDTIIRYTEDSVRTWVDGSDTPLNIWDDEYKLEGVQTGISSDGLEYSLTVIEPLHFVVLSRGVKSGILDIDVGDIEDIKLNYNDYTITIFGKTYSFGE